MCTIKSSTLNTSFNKVSRSLIDTFIVYFDTLPSMNDCKFKHILVGYGTVRIFYRATSTVFWEICLFWEHTLRNNCIHILCQEPGSDTVITCLLFLFKGLGSSFPGLELPTFQMNGKRSTNWTVTVIYALRTTKPVHKHHRNYKNLARETISPLIMVETVIIHARWLYICM